ncbi:MAG: putative sugar O-methyltransferase [Pseudomonadota bacterium]
MGAKELAAYFVSHSPGFHWDLDLSHIDNKHTNILREAYRQIEGDKAFNEINYRNWSEQSDLGVPAQMSFSAIQSNGLAKTLLKYVHRKVLRRAEDGFLLSALLDDIEIIKLIGAKELLIENPVHLTPGVRSFYFINGTSVNLRWLRYIYLLKRILDLNLLEKGGVWVDVGSYYGGLQGLVRKYNPKSRIVLVDFHHQLCRSFIYLSHLFPNAFHILPDQLPQYSNLGEIPERTIMYVPVSEYERIANQTVDLVTNFFSLGEMRREFFNIYMNSRLFQESRRVFLVNRFVSAPYFEKTYDSDVSVLDYFSQERKREYFDIFPIHHYLLINRNLFGRNGFRNVGSPYFEMLTSSSDL